MLIAAAIMPLSGCGAKTQATPPEIEAPRFRYPFNEYRAFSDLEKQCGFGPRNPGSVGHAKCLEWLKTETIKSADQVFSQSFQRTYSGKRYTFTNVYAAYGKPGGKWIILLAHWDTRPFADQDTDAKKALQPIPGANDGASGVAVLLELGRLLKAKKPPCGVLLAFVDGEDFGRDAKDMFLGSTELARDWKSRMKHLTTKFEYGILLDMIGAKDLRIPREGFSQQASPGLMNKIWGHAKDAGLEEFFPDQTGPSISDDHLPLIKAGIPTVDLISFDYAYWHTHQDTSDKCSPYSLKVVGEVVARTIYAVPQP